MTPLLNENLITTKDAGELSGYNSDYLARLARSGKIAGKRIGHSWLVDRDSLTAFLSKQGDRKVDYARALARAREEEYRAHRSLVTRATKTLTKPIAVPQFSSIAISSFRSQAAALAIAFMVVGGGAFAAKAAVIPQVAETTAMFAREVADGFGSAFGGISSHVAAKFSAVDDAMLAVSARVASTSEAASANSASPALLAFDFSSARMPTFENTSDRQLGGSIAKLPTVSAGEQVLTVDDLRASALGVLALATSPSLALDALANAYTATGERAYTGIGALFAGYRSLVEASGAQTLALAATTRDVLAGVPSLVNRTNLAFGTAIISATHAAIGADVSLAYGTAVAAPASARATVAFLGGAGDVLAGATSRVPALATAAFLHVTAVPATLAPAIASAVFNAEYAAAVRFVPATRDVSERYLALVKDTGDVAYTGATGAIALAGDLNGKVKLSKIGVALQDAYLGVLGKTALALDTFARIPKVAAVLSTMRTTSAPMLAAVQPALSAGEQVALATYEAIHGIFSSTTSALAALFTPSPSVVIPDASGLAKSRFAVATSTLRGGSTATHATQYPTYVTTINGVSQNYVDQSIATAKSSLLAAMNGMVQPVIIQGATNQQSIQQVNMIQNLGNLTNVTSNTGNFTALTAGSANITGSLLAAGSITSNTSAIAPFFTATDANATSTFAGGFDIGNGAFNYDATGYYGTP